MRARGQKKSCQEREKGIERLWKWVGWASRRRARFWRWHGSMPWEWARAGYGDQSLWEWKERARARGQKEWARKEGWQWEVTSDSQHEKVRDEEASIWRMLGTCANEQGSLFRIIGIRSISWIHIGSQEFVSNPWERQSTIGRFFPSPASESSWASLDETPPLPPLKKQARIIDAVHALLRPRWQAHWGKRWGSYQGATRDCKKAPWWKT